MKRIFKYQLSIIDVQTILIPRDAEILSVMNQRENVVVYAIVDEQLEKEKVEFRLFGTGHPVIITQNTHKFLGTVIIMGGELVWHVFVKRND